MINENPYIQNCESSTFSVLFDNYRNNKKINLIHGLIKYPDWNGTVDILQYVENLKQLRTNPRTYFVFDASTEGFSPFDHSFFDILYYSCKVHNINPEKIIFVSSNMLDNDNIIQYNESHSIKKSIKVLCFLSFKKMIADLVENTYGLNFDSNTAIEYFRKKTQHSFNGLYGLSLSRVNREHRIFANYTLCKENLQHKFAISQDKISEQEGADVRKLFHIDKIDFDNWQTKLPLTVDTADFETNHALTLNSHLHNSTLFQIVNETHVKTWNNTSLFYSEKTFRSIAHMQPFIIFGQPGCNLALEKYGFKLYHDLFDYSFDSIQDTKQRYMSIIQSVQHTINKLDKMSREEQIAWKFSQETILKHNFDCLMNVDLEKKKFKRLIKSL